MEDIAPSSTTPAEISLIILASSEISFECMSTNFSIMVLTSSKVNTKRLLKII